MNGCRRGLLSLAALTVVLAAAGSAQAQGFYGGYYGFNAGAGPYNLFDNERVVPYFSLYPPVYYSRPVARSYGWSPFAYPPGTMTPEVQAPAPEEIQNPHLPQNPQKTSAAPINRSAQGPVIENPYVVSAPRPTDDATAIAAD
jgi:hypothetical protein